VEGAKMGFLDIELGLNDKAKAVCGLAERFALEIMRPAGIELDKLHDPSDVIAPGSKLWDVIRKHRELGFHKMAIPRALGGMLEDVDPNAAILVNEQLGYGDVGIAESLAVSSIPFVLASMFPIPEIQGLARQFCDDTEAKMIGCIAFSEPDHGSDWILANQPGYDCPALAPSVRAVKKGDEYVINGRKAAWISNGTIATHAALCVSLDASKGMQGTGLAIMPLNLPGISRGKPLNKIGMRAYSQGEIIFEEVSIPKEMMVIADSAMATQLIRLVIAVMSGGQGILFLGLGRAAFDEALKYAGSRVQGGKTILEHQGVQLRLFEMFRTLEAARAYAHKVARYNAANPPGSTLHSMASKVVATETAFKVASEAVQIFGAYGLSRESPIEKMFRDARMGMIGEENNALSLAAASEFKLGSKQGAL